MESKRDYLPHWQDYRKRKLRFYAALAVMVSIVPLDSLVFPALDLTFLAFAWFLVVGGTMVHVRMFRCPRCSVRLASFGTMLWYSPRAGWGGAIFRECRNCGLPTGAETDHEA